MMKLLGPLIAGCSAGVLGGCASLPDEQITYYFPKTRTDITVTQTIGCYKDNKTVNVRSIASATVTTSYLADYSEEAKHHLSYRAFDGVFRDTDTGVTLTADGQLSAVNASVTGEGGAVVKSAVALAGVFTGVSGGGAPKDLGLEDWVLSGEALHPARETPEKPAERLCAFVAAYASKPSNTADGGGGSKSGKTPAPPAGRPPGSADRPQAPDGDGGDGRSTSVPTLSLTFTRRVEYIEDAGRKLHLSPSIPGDNDLGLVIPPDPNSKPFFDVMKQIPGLALDFTVVISAPETAPLQPTLLSGEFPAGQMLQVPGQDRRHVEIRGPAGDLRQSGAFWEDDIVIPTREAISVPITKADIFGKTQTAVTLGPTGRVEKLEYSKVSEAAALIGASGQIAGQAEGQTEAQKAAAVQSQADLIYQQQRLITCQLTPRNCASK